MSISAIEYLRHIRDEARFLVTAVEGVGVSRFMGDEVLKRACVRALEIIGEAAKKVPEETKARHPDLDWKRMAAMRDRLIHGYFEPRELCCRGAGSTTRVEQARRRPVSLPSLLRIVFGRV